MITEALKAAGLDATARAPYSTLVRARPNGHSVVFRAEEDGKASKHPPVAWIVEVEL